MTIEFNPQPNTKVIIGHPLLDHLYNLEGSLNLWPKDPLLRIVKVQQHSLIKMMLLNILITKIKVREIKLLRKIWTFSMECIYKRYVIKYIMLTYIA